MKILGIETSCDETSASIVVSGRKILSQVTSSSILLHTITGGVIPEIAAREQIKTIIPVIEQSLHEAELASNDIDAIAVTIGPGLIGSLLVGVESAKTISAVWNKPIIPVNHLLGHLYANWLSESAVPKFPAIGLIASGGHTDLILIKNHAEIAWVGGTRDDAAGEAFDKTARLLGLPYPGGPSIAKIASSMGKKTIHLPRPLINNKSLDFSFSGLKTAALREVNSLKEQDKLESSLPELASEIQEAITDVLVQKTLSAVEKNNVHTLIIAGGVAANERLKEKLQNSIPANIILHIPPPHLCTDNAAFIASCAYYNPKALHWSNIDANPSLRINDVLK